MPKGFAVESARHWGIRMKRRECLTILGAVIAGPLVARTQRWYGFNTVVKFDGAIDLLERSDISGHADSKTGIISCWFSNNEYFDLSTAEGRKAALYAAGRER